MQEDEKLRQTLQQFAMKETCADFTQEIMQQIETISAVKLAAKPLVNARLRWILAGVFAVICTLLLILSFKDQFMKIPTAFTLTIPANYTLQLIWFIIVFWIGMLINVLYQKKIKQVL